MILQSSKPKLLIRILKFTQELNSDKTEIKLPYAFRKNSIEKNLITLTKYKEGNERKNMKYKSLCLLIKNKFSFVVRVFCSNCDSKLYTQNPSTHS